MQRFRDFFNAEDKEIGRQEHPKAHDYKGCLREEGQLNYVFDRRQCYRRDALAAHLGWVSF